MTTHPVSQLLPYVSGDLDSAARARIEAHLAVCEACAAEVADMAEAHRALSHLPTVEPAPGFDERVAARVVAQSSWRPSSYRWAAAAVIALVVGTAATAFWMFRPVARDAAYMVMFFQDMRARQAAPPEERRRGGAALVQWIDALDSRGLLVDRGRALLPAGGREVNAGGFVMALADEIPAGEILTGFVVIQAAGYDEAARLARDCPLVVESRGRIVIRQVAR